MGIKFSLAFITGREDHRIDLMFDSLAHQVAHDDEIHLIVIDALSATMPNRFAHAIDFRIFRGGVTLGYPKPNPWQGPQRVTSRDWWAMSNARNTAFASVPKDFDYIAFLDDRAVLGPRWLDAIRRNYDARKSVIAGTYCKMEGDGRGPLTRDHRAILKPSGMINCGGGWLYGCTFALPLEWALEVNGFEEGCDSLTGEDYIFGLMLENNGRRIDFDTDLAVTQDRTLNNNSCKGAYRCTDKGASPHDKSHAALARFGKRKRTEFTPDLRALRERKIAGFDFPDVGPAEQYVDWYDGQPLSEMT